jgi:hypothetical protein
MHFWNVRAGLQTKYRNDGNQNLKSENNVSDDSSKPSDRKGTHYMAYGNNSISTLLSAGPYESCFSSSDVWYWGTKTRPFFVQNILDSDLGREKMRETRLSMNHTV